MTRSLTVHRLSDAGPVLFVGDLELAQIAAIERLVAAYGVAGPSCMVAGPAGLMLSVRALAPGQIAAIEQLAAAYRAETARRRRFAPARPPRSAVKLAASRPRARVAVVERSRQGVVYFMRHTPSGFVKIGRTVDLRARQHQVSKGQVAWPPEVQPGRVNVIAAQFFDDAVQAEGDFHQRFRELRVKGTEWFLSTRELVDCAHGLSIDDAVWDDPC